MFILSILKETLDLAFWVSSGDWKISITFIVIFPGRSLVIIPKVKRERVQKYSRINQSINDFIYESKSSS